MKRFFIHTFGCQMNEYDSERLTQALQENGWIQVSESSQADLLLVNTCTVRKLAEEKAFSLLGRWAKSKKDRPGTIVGMVGCLAQHMGKQAFQRAPSLDFLAGPRAVTRVPELAEQALQKKKSSEFAICEFGEGTQAPPGIVPSAYVAVMDGCNQYCSYCAVPKARGNEKSRNESEILAEVKRRVAAGTNEIVLLGQNITRYGIDLGSKANLADLLYRIAEAVPELLRLRFITGHPSAFTDRLIQCMADLPMVCEALHLPVQSGSDTILKAMRRGYSSAQYVDLVDRIRVAVPDLVLSTDIIVGFPGETQSDFQATLDLIDRCDFDMAYCFKYSIRTGTSAADMPDQMSLLEKEKRLAIVSESIEQNSVKRKAVLVGRKEKVLIEGTDVKTKQRLQGRTRGNSVVILDGPRDWIGQEVLVEITAAGNWYLMGEIVSQQHAIHTVKPNE
jgi:tRNA-2-methylthio-N6-dimethylallyladenosine synthase